MSCTVAGCGWLTMPCPFHGATPPRIKKTGRELRDKALEEVDLNAESDWKSQAATVVATLAQSGQPFTPDDVWAAGLPRPREPRALGPVMMRAVKSGLIEPTGEWVNSKQASQHATPVRVWRGTERVRLAKPYDPLLPGTLEPA